MPTKASLKEISRASLKEISRPSSGDITLPDRADCEKLRREALSTSFDRLAILASRPDSPLSRAMILALNSKPSQAEPLQAVTGFPYPRPRIDMDPVRFVPVSAPFPAGSVQGDPSTPTIVPNTFGAGSGVPVSFAFVRPTEGLISLAVADGCFGFGSCTQPLGDTFGLYSNQVCGQFSYFQRLPVGQRPTTSFLNSQRVTVTVDITVGDGSEPSPDNSVLLEPESDGGSEVYVEGTANLILSAYGPNNLIYKQFVDWNHYLEKRLTAQPQPVSELRTWVKDFSLSGHLYLNAFDPYTIEVDVSITLYANRNLVSFQDYGGFSGVNFADQTDRMRPWVTSPGDANPNAIDRSLRVKSIQIGQSLFYRSPTQ